MTKKVCIRKLNIRLLVSLALAMILSVTVFACPSFAAVYDCDIDVTQTIHVKGPYSKPYTEIHYSLKPVSGVIPLPGGKIGPSYNFGIKGEAKEVLRIRYDWPGEYVYSLHQLKPEFEGYSHDETIYTITVVAEDTPGGTVARIKTIIDSEGYKHSAIIFKNEFDPPEEPSFDPPEGSSNVKKNDEFNPPEGSSNVKTGDVSYLRMWIMMSLISGISFFMLIFYRRGNKIKKL